MKYGTRFTARARADLLSIELPVARRILVKVTELESDPHGSGTTELVNQSGIRDLPVGDRRVFYRFGDDELVVLAIRVRHRSVEYE